MGFQLVIAEGKEAGREFEFDQDSVLIGRTNECDVILYETGVSRKHAQISEEEGSFFIEDLGSSNGTRVNGETISGRLALKSGDAIPTAIGKVTYGETGDLTSQSFSLYKWEGGKIVAAE